MSDRQPSFAPEGAIAAFAAGFSAPWHGFRHMSRHRDLWRYGASPVALNLLITLFVLGLLVLAAAGLAVYVHPKFPEGAMGVVWEVLSIVAMLLVAVGLAACTWFLLNGILAGHYQGRLAAAVERQLGMRPDQIVEVPMGRQVADTLVDFAALVAVNAALLLLNCVPLVGSAAALVGALYFNCRVFGRDMLDHPLSLRGMRRREKRDFCRRHRWHTLGLGASVLALGLVPVLGAVVLTTATTGAVLLHRQLAQADGRTS